MRCFEEVGEVGAAWSKCPYAIPHVSDRPRHVERRPGGDAVSEMLGEDPRVVGVIAGQIAIGPSSLVFQRLRQIPVVDGAKRTEALLEHGVEELAVVIDAFHVWRAGSGRLDARPGDGKAVALLVEAFRQGHVLRIEVVLIARDVSRRSALHLAGSVRKPVPDRLAFSVLFPCALNLEGGGSCTPKEAVRESCRCDLILRHSPGCFWRFLHQRVSGHGCGTRNSTPCQHGATRGGQRTAQKTTAIHRVLLQVAQRNIRKHA